MHRARLMAAGATLLAATLALSACGTRTEPSTGGGGGGTEDVKVAKIGVIAPLTGDLSALGLGIRNSVDLAIKQANESNAIPGWKLEIATGDDQGLPDPGRNAATKLAGDKEMVAVVGTLNSSVAQAVQPVLQGAGIAEVSPANTGPSLTRGPDYATDPKRAYDNYFRTCTTDDIQGPFAAKYLLDAGIKSVATVNDKKAYGQGLVEAFAAAYKEGGGKVVASETINPEDKDFSAVISKVKGAKPDALYYGGEFPQSGPLSQQMKAAGLNIPLMGGDGMYDPAYIELAGAKSDNDLATSVGAPTDTLPTAKEYLKAYEEGGYDEPYGAYGAYSYDAANAIINALKVSLKDSEDVASALEPTIAEIGKVKFDGATGPVQFDEYGDTVTRVLTVYKVKEGKWATEKTGEFK